MPTTEAFEQSKLYRVEPLYIGILACIYEFETDLVSNKGGVGESFNHMWKIADLVDALNTEGYTETQTIECLEWLWKQRRLVPFHASRDEKFGFEMFRTDTCELVRQSTFTYPRLVRDGLLMNATQAGVTWKVERKEIPERRITMEDCENNLKTELSHECRTNADLDSAIEIGIKAFENLMKARNIEQPKLSKFQLDSVTTYIRQNLSSNEKHQIIEAGTGSGKTFGFQLGTIILLVNDRLKPGFSPKTSHIMVYPRVALALDQYSSFCELIKSANLVLENKQKRPIQIILDAGQKLKEQAKMAGAAKGDYSSVSKATKWVYGIHRPDIIISNPDTLKNRLWKHESSNAIRSSVRSVVLDEVHLYEGLTGANYSNVIRRLRMLCNTNIQFCGVSATIADGTQHMANVTGCSSNLVEITKPDDDDLVLNGIVHHILHAQVEGSSYISNLTNLTSIQQHQRNRRLSKDVFNPKHSRKAIGFADSLHLLGQWSHFFAETEGWRPLSTAVKKDLRKNNGKLTKKDLTPPKNYPFRFNRPLINAFDELEDQEAAIEHCRNCVNNIDSVLDISSKSISSIPQSKVKKSKRIMVEEFEIGPSIGITNKCGFFNRGLCWREEIYDDTIEIWQDGPKISAKARAPVLLTSDTIKSDDSSNPNNLFEIDVASRTILADTRITGSYGKKIIANIGLSSPSMEVGVDLDNLTEAILFKAIRNVASYRQKVGRLGREGLTDSVAQTLVSFRPLDYFYYQNPSALLSNDHVDAIPIASSNENIQRTRIMNSILDYVAAEGGEFLIVTGKNKDKELKGVATKMGTLRRGITTKLKNSGADEKTIEDSWNYLNLIFQTILGTDISTHAEMSGTSIVSRSNSNALIEYNAKGIKAKKALDSIEKSIIFISSNFHEYREVIPEWNQSIEQDVRKIESSIIDGECNNEILRVLRSLLEFLEQGRNELIAKNDIKSLVNLLTQNQVPFIDEEMKGRISDLTSDCWIKTFIIKDWNLYLKENRERPKMFDEFVRVFRRLKSKDGFTMPRNLYTAPGTKLVDVWIPFGNDSDTGNQGRIESVSLDEARYSYLPGMLTYRKSGQPLKSSLYQHGMVSDGFEFARIDLNKLSAHREEGKKGHTLTFEPGKLYENDLPWGLNNFFPHLDPSDEIEIRLPRKLITRYAKDSTVVDNESLLLLNDGDDHPSEDEEVENDDDDEEYSRLTTNLPSCYGINWQKVENNHELEKITPFNEDGLWGVEFDSSPLLSGFFDDISYSNNVSISEFTAGFTRRYTGLEDEAVFVYTESSDPPKPMVIGSNHNAPSIKFTLNQNTFEQTKQLTKHSIESGADFSQLIGFIRAALISDWDLNVFLSDHVIRIISQKVPEEATLDIWLKAVSELSVSDVEEYSSGWENEWSISQRKPMGIDKLKNILNEKQKSWKKMEHINALLDDWLTKSYLHSLGIHLLQAARATSGCRDQDIGLHFDVNGKSIWLYDRVEGGSGAINTIKRWFEIPRSVKQLRSTPSTYNKKFQEMPTKDFRDWFFSFIRPCVSRSETSAAIRCRELNVKPKSNQMTAKFVQGVNFILKNQSKKWDELPGEVLSFEQLERANLNRHRIAKGDQAGIDSIRRVTTFCTTSCPRCLQELGISPLGPLLGPIYSNKRMVDYSFDFVIENCGERVTKRRLDGLNAVTDSMVNYGEIDANSRPIELPDGSIFRPLLQSEHICELIVDDDPIDEEGRINRDLVTTFIIPKWRHTNA